MWAGLGRQQTAMSTLTLRQNDFWDNRITVNLEFIFCMRNISHSRILIKFVRTSMTGIHSFPHAHCRCNYNVARATCHDPRPASQLLNNIFGHVCCLHLYVVFTCVRDINLSKTIPYHSLIWLLCCRWENLQSKWHKTTSQTFLYSPVSSLVKVSQIEVNAQTSTIDNWQQTVCIRNSHWCG